MNGGVSPNDGRPERFTAQQPMKKIISLLLLCASQAFAAPFLDCGPIPRGPAQPTLYQVNVVVSGNEVSTTVPATVDENGSVRLHCDLAPFALSLNTSYRAYITAFNGPDPGNLGFNSQSVAVEFTLTDATHAVITAISPAPPEHFTISPK